MGRASGREGPVDRVSGPSAGNGMTMDLPTDTPTNTPLVSPSEEGFPEASDSAEPAGAALAAPLDSDNPAEHRFECRSCGFVYDPAEGVKKLGIPAGTPFVALDPVAFRCPVCRSRVGAFLDIGPRNKPSGFEQNLKYGFGVNRLTPGQKNVLIFGAFALAIAFFLSLYSLR